MIFISYASPDRPLALALRDALGSAFIDVSLDRGDDWYTQIPIKLAGSRVVAVLVSSHTPRAHFQTEEILLAIEYARKGSLRIVPLICDPVELPFGLRSYDAIDVSCGNISAAADTVLHLANMSLRVPDRGLPFVERSGLLQRAREVLAKPRAPRLLILEGRSGSGRTVLARELTIGNTLFVDCESVENLPQDFQSYESIVLDNICAASPILRGLHSTCVLTDAQRLVLICNALEDRAAALASIGVSDSDAGNVVHVDGLSETEVSQFRTELSQARSPRGFELSYLGWVEISRKLASLPALLRLLAQCVDATPKFDERCEARFRRQLKSSTAAAEVLNLWMQTPGAGSGLPSVLLLALCSSSAVGMIEDDLAAVVHDSLDGGDAVKEVRASLVPLATAGLLRSDLVCHQLVHIPRQWVRETVSSLLTSGSAAKGLEVWVRRWRQRYLDRAGAGRSLPWSAVERAVLCAQFFIDELGKSHAMTPEAEQHLNEMLELVRSPEIGQGAGWLSVLRRFHTLSRDCSAVIGIMHIMTRLAPNRILGDLSYRMRHQDGWANASCVFAATYHWVGTPTLASSFGLDVIRDLQNRLEELKEQQEFDLEIAAILGALTTMGNWQFVADYWRRVAPRFHETLVTDLTFLVLASDLNDEGSYRWASAERWRYALDDRHKRVVRAFLRERRSGANTYLPVPPDPPRENTVVVDLTRIVAECTQSASFAEFVKRLDERESDTAEPLAPFRSAPNLRPSDRGEQQVIPPLRKRPVGLGQNIDWFVDRSEAGDFLHFNSKSPT